MVYGGSFGTVPTGVGSGSDGGADGSGVNGALTSGLALKVGGSVVCVGVGSGLAQAYKSAANPKLIAASNRGVMGNPVLQIGPTLTTNEATPLRRRLA